MATFPSLETAPNSPGDVYLWLKRSHTALWNATRGKFNVTLEQTLATGTVTTALMDPRLGGQSWIDAMPLTAAAAAELPTLWYSGQGKGVATVNHTNSATADRTFRFAILG